ncbi:MAG: nitroreductase, partial [Bradyrhizobium sp.]|nr:nitroreductase [Bradyrhizobium sp.]
MQTDAEAVQTDPIAILEELMAARFSCRSFRIDAVPRATIERILT